MKGSEITRNTLDLFSGVDGGVGAVTLWGLLSSLDAKQDLSEREREVLRAFKLVDAVCARILNPPP